MWFIERGNIPDWSAACRHLAARNPAMAQIIERVGRCTLSPGRDRFISLCEIIFTQQLSMAVATALFARFSKLFPNRRPTAPLVLQLGDDDFRKAGLSRQKTAYLKALAARWQSGQVPSRRFRRMTDDQIVETLLPIKGIGRWSCEMFLIFVLNRPDILPVDDLGIRKAVQSAYRLPKIPESSQVMELGEKWRPWRTIATWYLWRSGAIAE